MPCFQHRHLEVRRHQVVHRVEVPQRGEEDEGPPARQLEQAVHLAGENCRVHSGLRGLGQVAGNVEQRLGREVEGRLHLERVPLAAGEAEARDHVVEVAALRRRGLQRGRGEDDAVHRVVEEVDSDCPTSMGAARSERVRPRVLAQYTWLGSSARSVVSRAKAASTARR